MALRDNNPNDGKIHAARLRSKGSSVKRQPVKVLHQNAVKRGSGTRAAIVQQETTAMHRSAWYNENNHNSGLSCYESQNR